MAFADSTRLKHIQLPAMARPAGGGLTSQELPKTGILSYILLAITATVGGTVTTANALGAASILRRVTLTVNAGQKIFDFSGAGYHYLIRDMLSENAAHLSWTTARSAVTATTFRLDMVIPVALNNRDELGLIMLQNETTLATLSIDWEVDANVVLTGGGTVTSASAQATLGVFEVPSNPENWPTFNTVHQMIEENMSWVGAQEVVHNIARGGTLVGAYYLITTTSHTLAELVVQQSNTIEKTTPDAQRLRFDLTAQGRDLTLAGALTGFNNRVFWDLAGSDGLGMYGTVRDVLDTQALTSIFTRFQMAATGGLIAIRRQLLPLAA